ncbi:hypothetical protein SESBI_45777 [Sesbania bispinosa]|nr:hypothetical protein SESBI_45777 [Sesbania bispinosa]
MGSSCHLRVMGESFQGREICARWCGVLAGRPCSLYEAWWWFAQWSGDGGVADWGLGRWWTMVRCVSSRCACCGCVRSNYCLFLFHIDALTQGDEGSSKEALSRGWKAAWVMCGKSKEMLPRQWCATGTQLLRWSLIPTIAKY